MQRREFLKTIGAATAGIPASFHGPASARAGEKPNIVLIISDDQGWTDYGFMGHPSIRTPHIDRLASQSLVFRHGYVPSSLCCPSLSSIITGLYPHQTKVTGNEPPLPRGLTGRAAKQDRGYREQVKKMTGFLEGYPTLPRELARIGYVSLQTGKWWMGPYSNGGFTHGMTHGDPDRGGRHGDEGLAIGREGMQPIFDFIDRAGGKPFFVWYAPLLPHQPHNPPQRLLDRYVGKSPSPPIAKYWAMCEWFDETCGALMDYLDSKGLAQNTIVVYLADNGWIQEPAKDRFRSDSKQSQYDGGLRTPLMIRWPGHVKPGQSNTPVLSIDIAPTILQACGLTRNGAIPGVDLLDEKALNARKAIFGACFLHNAVDLETPARNLTYRWCVAGRWKLILPNRANVTEARKPGRAVEVELYDLGADPFEEHNLARQQPERVGELTRLVDSWWPAKVP